MQPTDARRAATAVGFAAASVAMRHAGRRAARRGARAEPRLAIAVVLLDAVVTLVLQLRRRRKG